LQLTAFGAQDRCFFDAVLCRAPWRQLKRSTLGGNLLNIIANDAQHQLTLSACPRSMLQYDAPSSSLELHAVGSIVAKGFPQMDSQEPKAIIQRYYEEIGNQRQLTVADEIIAPHFRLFPDSPPPHGPEGVKQFITWLCVNTFPDLHVTIEALIAEEEQVAAFVTLHATQTSPIDWLSGIGPIAATGKRFALREYVLWRVVGGKIVERMILADTWGVLQQLGVQLVLGAPAQEATR